MTPWSVWVLEYAVAEEFPMSLAVYGAHNRGTRRAPFSYVVAKRDHQVVLVDVGFGDTARQRAIAEDSAVTNWRDPVTVLAQIGLHPDDVTQVVVTHAHYDHFGNSGAFPNAQFYMSAREVQFWVAELTLPPELRTFVSPIDPADLVAAVDLAAQGRLELLSGGAEALFPGLDVLPAWDTHTPGSLYVRVDTVDGSLVFAGDNVYSWDNLEGLDGDGVYRPVGLVVGSNIAATRILAEMIQHTDRRVRRIIPIHEDRLRTEYPSAQSANGAMVVELALAPGEPSALPR